MAENVAEVWTPIDEVLAGGALGQPCPQIDWPLHLVGFSHVVVHDTVANGVHHFTIVTGVHGDATDGAGNSFAFAYDNHVTEIYVSAPNQPLSVTLTDHFNLEGPSGNVRSGLIVLIRTDAAGNLVVDVKPSADINCDPI
jgi:hypothetical protein